MLLALRFSETEICKRLKRLPCVFTGRFYFDLEHLEAARAAGWFTFEALESGSTPSMYARPRRRWQRALRNRQ